MEKLSESELVIMTEIWKEDRPLYFDEIVDLVKEQNWAESTVRNFLQRIIRKGYLETEKDGRKNIYITKVSKDYLNRKSGKLLKKAYNNSLKNFIAELYDARSISQEDLVELKDYLDSKIGEDRNE